MPDTLDLFPDHPAPVPGSMMALVAMPGIKLSPAQKSFKQLVADIAAAEKRLQEITALIDLFRPLFAKKLRPLYDEHDLLDREMVLFLDAQFARKGWTRNQRKTMQEIICRVAAKLFGSAHGEEMEAVFDRHSEITAADLAAADSAEFEAELEDLFGVKLDADDEARSPEQALQEAMHQRDQQEQERTEQAEARSAARRKGKKSARQAKAEQQELDAGKLL